MDEPNSQPAAERLLADLAAGREQAFERLYDEFGGRLYRAAWGMLGRREDAEDAVQEVFAAVARSRGRLVDIRDLAAYLFASLRRAAARRSLRRPLLSFDDDAHRGAEIKQPITDPRCEALREALTFLSTEQREVITLKIDGELTFAQIGQVLDISPNTAASRYRYALERLRNHLKE